MPTVADPETTRPSPKPALTVAARGRAAGQLRELVVHLALREIASAHRFTLLGWLWPLVRQLAQLAVLVVVFSTFLDLGIEHFAVYVFSGLVAWSWFSTSLYEACGAIAGRRHLVLQPGLPTITLPVVATAVPLVDLLMALPVLLIMAATQGLLSWWALLLPVIVAVQFVLTVGLAWIVASVTVYMRDTPNVVGVGLTMLFYFTPVFYSLDRVPQPYHDILYLNPMVALLDAYRDVLMEGRPPGAAAMVALGVGATSVAAIGCLVFRRLRDGFVDEL